MNLINLINDLKDNTLSKKGYIYLLSLFRGFVTYCISVSNQKENTQLFHKFLASFIASNSMRYIAKIPDSYKMQFFINKLIQFLSKEENVTLAREETILQTNSFQDQVKEIANLIEYSSVPIILDCLFVDPIPSLDDISSKYNKSPEYIADILTTFRKQVVQVYHPNNIVEGTALLEQLHHYLEKINTG